MHLPPDRVKRLADAIADALPREEDIRQLAEDVGAGRAIATGTYDDMLNRIIGWAASRDKINVLVQGAREINSDNEMLRRTGEEICKLTTTIITSAAPIRAGLQVLTSMAEMPAVSIILSNSRGRLEEARRRLQQVRVYKDVHDVLHDIQKECFEQLELELRVCSDDTAGVQNCNAVGQTEEDARSSLDISFEDLEFYLDRYGIYIGRLQELRDGGSVRASELEFIEKQLVPAKDDWSWGVKEKNLRSLYAAKKKLWCTLGRYHPKIDTALHTVAADMLPIILGVVDEISEALGEAPGPPNFRLEVQRLASLNRSLSELVDHHHRWQEFDDEMRRIADLFRRFAMRFLIPMFSGTWVRVC